MKKDLRSGLKAGLISGPIWGALMAVSSFLEVQIKYPIALSYYGGLYNKNASIFGGMTATQYINYNLELNTILFLVVGVGFGALVGLLFVYISPRFLPSRGYIVKGLIVSVFLWLVYNLSLVSTFDIFELLSSLGISLFGGYLLAFFYSKDVPVRSSRDKKLAGSSSRSLRP